jgi:K+-sensing histidine kinase KdpD
MAAEIEKLVGDLRDVDNLRRKLLQELAHDLRTPLASMKSLLESLLYQNDKMTKEQREENLILTIKEVEYFQHLVEDLLFLSGVHDLNYRGNFVSVDVVDVIQHEVSVLGEMNKNIKISFIYEQFYYIKADDHLFQRLIKNALSNAIENASTGVIVKLVEDHQVIIVQIINDGNKLNAEDEITFGKKRATRRLNDNFSGKISIGLGAVIMAKICEIHSASMRIRNNGEDANAGVTLELKFSVSKED